MKTSKKHSHSDMYPAIERWQKSGLTQADFCRQEQLSRNIFKYWFRKYREEKKDTSATPFIPVQVLPKSNPPPTGKEVIRIHYPNGINIECPSSISREQLQALIRL